MHKRIEYKANIIQLEQKLFKIIYFSFFAIGKNIGNWGLWSRQVGRQVGRQ